MALGVVFGVFLTSFPSHAAQGGSWKMFVVGPETLQQTEVAEAFGGAVKLAFRGVAQDWIVLINSDEFGRTCDGIDLSRRVLSMLDCATGERALVLCVQESPKGILLELHDRSGGVMRQVLEGRVVADIVQTDGRMLLAGTLREMQASMDAVMGWGCSDTRAKTPPPVPTAEFADHEHTTLPAAASFEARKALPSFYVGAGYGGRVSKSGTPAGWIGAKCGFIRSMTPNLGISGELGYQMLGKHEYYGSSANITAQGCYVVSTQGAARPIVNAGIGLYSLSGITPFYGSDWTINDTKTGISLGGGINVGREDSKVTVGVDVKFHLVFTDFESTKILQVMVGVGG
jgi:hypothetical protein